MSSPPTNPYKSRLLNLINRQSLRLKDQLNRTGRHLKIAVEMGVQILIYPLYLLVQTGRITQRQFKQKIQRQQVLPPESSSHPQVTSDQAIEHILESLESWLSEGQDNISPSAVSPPLDNISLSVSTQKDLIVRGLATLVQNQKLVLVSSDNLLIDIFAPTEQKQLKKRIYWEIANYKYQRRFQERAAKKFPSLIPAFQINSPNVVPPVRWFWTVMRWIQTSDVAIAINLFGESTFIRRRPSVSQIAPSREITEKTNSMTGSEALDNHPTNLKSIQALIQAAIEYFFGRVRGTQIENKLSPQLNSTRETTFLNLAARKRNTPQTIKLTIQKDPKKITPKSAIPTQITEPDPFQIQILIQAAIDYFFGTKKQGFLVGNKANAQSELSQRQSQPLTNSPEPDPWLTWDDLFSPESTQENINPSTESPVKPLAKLPGTRIEIKPKKTVVEKVNPNIPQQVQAQSLTIKHSQKRESKSLQVTEQTSSKIDSTSPQPTSLEATPEWIETQATPIGYVKHPLVKILEVLDLIIYWFEKLWLRFWNWLIQKFNKD